ncbi:sporulation-delaying protein SdpB family protein [Micromonospora lupini]|uniref:sporulation-delaying protein SdpB family protein n=1 Tax=Micromonospora lupini TaxID=285679 RepID=UPI0014319A20|nr:sporulation-delaying protein SdpB family protein [Micromonospora lupini]
MTPFDGPAERTAQWARACPWTTTVGLARAVLAAGTLLTVLSTPYEVLLSPLSDGTVPPVCGGPGRLGLWCVVPDGHRWLAVLISAVVLCVVIAGWRPQITGVLHWWVAWSFTAGVTIQDGGDQVATVIALLLLPITLTDRRRWHWQRGPVLADDATPGWSWLVARVARVLIMVQVFVIYLHAAIAKLGVTEWADGTALWYWLRNPQFGAAGWLSPLTDRVIASPAGVMGLTWGSMTIEFLLACALFMRPVPRRILLVAGLGLHLGIAAAMGLVSFLCAMAAALLLYLTPVGQELRETWPVKLLESVRTRRQKVTSIDAARMVTEPSG